MRVVERGEVRIRWPERARRRLLPSRAHDLAIFAAEPLPTVSAARLAASAFEALSARRRRVPDEARAIVARLRLALVAAPPEVFEAARAAVEPPRTTLARGLLASAFTAVDGWTLAAARAYLDKPHPAPLIEDFGPFVTDPALGLALVEASARSPYGLREHALDLLAHLAQDAVAPLDFMLFERWSDSSVRSVAAALSLVDSDRAGRALLPLLASGPLRTTARAWARRHRDRAVPLLRELAVDPSERALDMAQRGELATVVEPLLRELDPPRAETARWPASAPAELQSGPVHRPDFVTLERLPRLHTRAGEALPAVATGRVIARWAAGDDRLPGLDADSLAAFADAAHRAWLEHSGQSRQDWVFRALSLAIDDARVPELAAHAERSHREGRAARAARTLEALADRGTPAALLHVERVARTSDYPKLRRTARAALARAAARLDLEPEELSDRATPTLGLDASGERTLSLGDRRVVLHLEPTLELRVCVEGGAPRRTFPPRRQVDDPARYDEAKAAFTTGRREARVVREALVSRLERMMIHQRTTRLADFDARFVQHPLMRPLVERLVLTAGDRRLRLAEDRTYADLDDLEHRPAIDARVGVAHPAELSEDERGRWAERFADYALVQPFRQLGRPTYVAEQHEREASRVLRLEGLTRPWERLSELRKAGFTGRSPDGIRITRFERELERIGRVEIAISPGLHVGSPVGSGPQQIVRVTVDALESLEPVLASEALLVFERLY